MKGSIIIVSFFIAGVLLGRFVDIPAILTAEAPTLYALYILMFLVGISIGSDKKALQALETTKLENRTRSPGNRHRHAHRLRPNQFRPKRQKHHGLPCRGIRFRLLLSFLHIHYPVQGSRIGHYRPRLEHHAGTTRPTCRPLLVRYFGKLAPISVGGATTADTTLPIITKFCGKEFVVISIVHGITVDLSVPFLVTFFCTI